MLSSASSTAPIFIIGIRSRSGTTYLSHLLRLHPDCCDVPAPIWEDFLLTHADLLAKYARSTYSHWHHWVVAEGVEERLEDKLFQCIGDGLISFLASRVRSRRLVTKMPGVRNLEYFFKLFPHGRLLILVRDGRAVAESAVKTSGFKPSSVRYESAMRSWARGAKTILRFDQATKHSDFKYLIVRYEDLWSDIKGELSRIFDFLGLDVSTYDFDAATNLAIRGSSVFRGGEEKVQWKRPVEKTTDFNPMLRWNHWSHGLHERFNWIAGEYLEQFDYEVKKYKTNRPLWTIWNLVLDMIWPIRSLLQSISRTLKRFLKRWLGEERVVKIRCILSTSRSGARNPSKAMGSDS
ncbi:MAG: sulfotransferase family protein [Candidatus Entotheonellia bacterium]